MRKVSVPQGATIIVIGIAAANYAWLVGSRAPFSRWALTLSLTAAVVAAVGGFLTGKARASSRIA
ncbi:hypothetical protein PQR05_37830 [Paraburkholderia sediminicola]|uniref:Uncharacterized protein n=1 Tax=Paraburkholderia metrosideri TaxID=580937 RepID=A0ABW9E608_9BURK